MQRDPHYSGSRAVEVIYGEGAEHIWMIHRKADRPLLKYSRHWAEDGIAAIDDNVAVAK